MENINYIEETNIWIPLVAFLLFKMYSCKKCKKGGKSVKGK